MLHQACRAVNLLYGRHVGMAEIWALHSTRDMSDMIAAHTKRNERHKTS